jgi:hypothetical protein
MKHYHDLRRKQVTDVASDQLRQLMLYMIDQRFYASHGNLGYNDCTVVMLNRKESRELQTNGPI